MTGKDVRRIRDKLGLTQVEFAELLDVPLSTLTKWEQDVQEPRRSAESLLKLAERGLLKKP